MTNEGRTEVLSGLRIDRTADGVKGAVIVKRDSLVVEDLRDVAAALRRCRGEGCDVGSAGSAVVPVTSREEMNWSMRARDVVRTVDNEDAVTGAIFTLSTVLSLPILFVYS